LCVLKVIPVLIAVAHTVIVVCVESNTGADCCSSYSDRCVQ
jgi:hypothetical protein